jgi:hypothetical protein
MPTGLTETVTGAWAEAEVDKRPTTAIADTARSFVLIMNSRRGHFGFDSSAARFDLHTCCKA